MEKVLSLSVLIGKDFLGFPFLFLIRGVFFVEYVTLSELFWSIMTNSTSGVLLFLFIFRFIFESIRTTVFDR